MKNRIFQIVRAGWELSEEKNQAVNVWIFEHKDKIATVLIVLATIALFFNTAWSSQKAELQSMLLYEVGMVAVANSAVGVNISEIQLRRSLAEMCHSAPPADKFMEGGCNSNDLLLKMAALQKDSLQGQAINITDSASTSLAGYRVVALAYDRLIWASGALALFFLIFSITATLKRQPKFTSKNFRK